MGNPTTNTWPVNENDEILLELGTGTTNKTSNLPAAQIPHNAATDKVKVKLPVETAIIATDASANIKLTATGVNNFPLAAGLANTLAVIGDSITAHWTTTTLGSTSTYETKQWGYLAWALNLSGHRLTVISDSSKALTCVQPLIGSVPSSSFDIQLTAAIASGARHLLMMGGLNDIEVGSTSAAIQAAWKNIIARAIAAGMKIWWCTQNPIASGGAVYTVARQAQNMEMNDWIRQYASSVNAAYNKNAITVVDLYSKAVDPASATGTFITNGNTNANDDHPSSVAAYYMGKELARVWSANIPETPQLVSSNVDNYGYSSVSRNILDNGLFINSSGGVGTGWSTAVIGSATLTPSIQARSDGYGNDQQLLATWTSVPIATDFVRITSSDVKARVSDGDWLVLMCEITCSSITNLANIRVGLTMNGAGIGAGAIGKSATAMQLDSAQEKALPEGFTAVYKTIPIQYTASTMGALTSVTAAISVFGTATAGGATVKIGRASIRKLVTT